MSDSIDKLGRAADPRKHPDEHERISYPDRVEIVSRVLMTCHEVVSVSSCPINKSIYNDMEYYRGLLRRLVNRIDPDRYGLQGSGPIDSGVKVWPGVSGDDFEWEGK